MTTEKQPTRYCSFCGKSQHEVINIIAGPEVYICDECVAICLHVLVDLDIERIGLSFAPQQAIKIKDLTEHIVRLAQARGAA